MPPLVHGRYDVTEKLGEGGMGVVYRAIDTRLGRPVALKVVHERLAQSPDARERLVREAQVAASLNHPNICTIHEVFDLEQDARESGETAAIGHGPVIVFELVEGETLHALLARGGRLGLRQLLDIAVQIADGLAEAHQRHIVHRDLKPQNVLISANGRVKILDFGLARSYPHAVGHDAATVRIDTVSGERPLGAAVKGTVPYMSPEQAVGKPIDARSDVFSFGIMLYEMAGGRRPFAGEATVEVIARILESEPPPLLEVRPDLPGQLERIIQRCLRKNPADRYNDTRDLLAELREVQDGLRTLSGERAPAAVPARGRLQWARGWWALTAVAVVVAALVGYWLTRVPSRAPAVAAHRQITFVGDASFPTISPDGNFLAYVRGEPWGRASRTLEPLQPQNVMIQDLAGGGRSLEVGECKVCAALSWSPDGGTLLVSEPPRMWLIPRLGGTVRRLEGSGFTAGTYVAWSPDGSEIATASFGSKGIVFVNTATGQSRRVELRWPFPAMRALAWSASGRRLVVVTAASDGQHSFWLVSPDGQNQDKVLDEPGRILSVKWSPHGDAIYYLREMGETSDLWRLGLTADTGTASAAPEAMLVGAQAGPNFSLAADGRRLLYTRELHYSNLWVASIDPAGVATPPRQITSGTSRDQFPAVSPDGMRVAFVRSEGTASNIYIMPIRGGAPQQLTFQLSIVGAPAWSPDGKTLAFCAHSHTNVVWKVDAGGGSPVDFPKTRCTTATSEVPVTWWPRPEILYQRPDNRTYHVLDPDSSSERPLADDSVGWLFGPRPTRDGSVLAAFWNRKDGRGIWLIPWPAGAPSFALKQFAWPLTWSADGRTLYAYVHAPTTEIVAISRSGGAPTTLRSLTGQRISLVPSMSPDGKTVVYSAYAIHSDVWMVQDFDPGNVR